MSKETLRLVLVKKTITKGKNKFNTYFTLMKLPEAQNGEAVQHSVTVKFRKDVDTSSFGKRGIITVDKKEISAPTIYQITKNEKKHIIITCCRAGFTRHNGRTTNC